MRAGPGWIREKLLSVVVLVVVSNQVVTAVAPKNATFRVPLVAEFGTHNVNVFVGEPPVRQSLIVDTGSRLTAWACRKLSPTSNKKQPINKSKNSNYDPYRSSTSSETLTRLGIVPSDITCNDCRLKGVSRCQTKNNTGHWVPPCRFQQRYTEGSTWEAFEVTDMVSLGVEYEQSLPYATAFTFGCQTSLSGLFATQEADGILGLAHSNFSLPHTLATVTGSAFSLCFSSTGGWLGFGGSLLDYHTSKMKYTRLVKSLKGRQGMYGVSVEQVWMGDVCLTCVEPALLVGGFNEGKGTVLDSGTTDTYFPKSLRSIFRQEWRTQVGSNKRVLDMAASEIASLPIVRIVLKEDVTLTMHPEHYMERTGRRKWTCRLYASEESGSVLGINAMMGHDVLFDWQGGTVGIADADCG